MLLHSIANVLTRDERRCVFIMNRLGSSIWALNGLGSATCHKRDALLTLSVPPESMHIDYGSLRCDITIMQYENCGHRQVRHSSVDHNTWPSMPFGFM